MNDTEPLLSNDNFNMSHDSNFASMSEVKIILIGKTGTGKSATGNTILGQGAFLAEASPEQVTSKPSKKSAYQGRRMISVIDMPGFYGSFTKEDMQTQTKQCVDLSVPGPHVFLLVINLGARYTEEDVNTVNLIQENFGEGATRYIIVLFTHADQLKRKTLQQYVRESQHLRKLTNSCGGRYHAFNNEDMMNRTQVTELMKKIDTMIVGNGGNHYTNKMFEEAQKKMKAEEMKKKAEEEMKKKKVEEMEKQLEEMKKELEEMKKTKAEEMKKKVEEMEKTKAEEMKKKVEEMEKTKAEEMKKKVEEMEKTKVEEIKEKAIDVAAGVGSAVGTGAVVAGGIVLIATQSVLLPVFLIGAGAAIAGMGVTHAVKKFKQTREKTD